MKELLKLIRCEIWKYKRNKTIPLITIMAILFPLALVVMTKSNINGIEEWRALYDYYDYLFSNNLAYSFMLFLPCLIGCVGTVIFFSDRDYDTFKNLRTIPITCGKLVIAKLIVLYIWSIFYAILTTVSITVFCAVVNYKAIYDFPIKILVSILAGITIVSVSLPVVVIIIYFNQNYVLSILLSFSYSILHWFLIILFARSKIMQFLPLITGLFWTSYILAYRKNFLFGDPMNAIYLSDHIRVLLCLNVIMIFSITLILRFYKKWSR